MTIAGLIIATKAFKQASPSIQKTVLSKSLIGVFQNAHDCKVAGCTYEEWLLETSAGTIAKEIVKEFFANTTK